MTDFNFQNWLDEIQAKIKSEFKERLLFLGCQGSYVRGEATGSSDVDMVVILDRVTLDELKAYKNIVKSMPYPEKACGFISGKSEIENWSKADLFQFVYDTKPIYGSLNDFIAPLTSDDVKAAVKSGAQNLYHAACHSFLYDADIKQSLAMLYKMTFFIVQAEYFLQTNEYVPTKIKLIEKLDAENRQILKTCMEKDSIPDLGDVEVEKLYSNLIQWCSNRV